MSEIVNEYLIADPSFTHLVSLNARLVKLWTGAAWAEGPVYFRDGDYGLAEQKFRKAVEVTPKDAEAWLGLAASYDQLRRFDLADNAYERVFALGSDNAVMMNNAGYSQLMRGNIEGARRFLLRAYELDPNNPYIQNNLALLGESKRTVKRTEL